MTDFIKFCPNCRTLFRDSDLYHRHLATCGAVQVQETEAVREPKKTAGKTADGGKDSRRQTADGSRGEERRPTAGNGWQ